MSAANNSDRAEIQLGAGTVRYRDIGQGQRIGFVHGLLVDGPLWDGVARRVAAGRHMAPRTRSARRRCLDPVSRSGERGVRSRADGLARGHSRS
jgi:hypothetical protein